MKYRMIPMSAAEVRYDAHRYAMALSFLAQLRDLWKHGDLTPTQYKQLRQQALDGDKHGAEKELGKIMLGG